MVSAGGSPLEGKGKWIAYPDCYWLSNSDSEWYPDSKWYLHSDDSWTKNYYKSYWSPTTTCEYDPDPCDPSNPDPPPECGELEGS